MEIRFQKKRSAGLRESSEVRENEKNPQTNTGKSGFLRPGLKVGAIVVLFLGALHLTAPPRAIGHSADGCGGRGAGRGACAGKQAEGRAVGSDSILVKGSGSGGDVLELSLEGAAKYRGKMSTCSIIAFRAVKAALEVLWEGDVPAREDVRIISRHGCGGSRDVFEYVARAVTRGGEDFKIDVPEGRRKNERSVDDFTFTFIRKDNGNGVTVKINDSIFPENFFEMRERAKATDARSGEKEAFRDAKEIVTLLAKNLPPERLFRFTASNVE